ncbi:MAG: tyrosine-type recombinase/integrase [Candidatus Cloacimonetes bacterium]|jgi:integrase/recombinase XerD|nr:tyrosine-type recombinase/integrase [Candidatus Cloacimonadota bacterium]
MDKRTSPHKKALQIAKYFRSEHPDYNYIRAVFKCLREELEVEVTAAPKKLPYVPTEEEVKKYYEVVWSSKNTQHMLIVKTLLYTGIRVSELTRLKISNIDLTNCQMRIEAGKGKKGRIVPFPKSFREVLALHISNAAAKGASCLFESSWKKPYSDRGIRRILETYSEKAGLTRTVSPHKLRHFLFTWLKKQGLDDALIQPYSGHESRQSLEVYSKLSLCDAQEAYEDLIKKFPI